MTAAAEMGVTPLEYSVSIQAYNSGGQYEEEREFQTYLLFGNPLRELVEEVTAIPDAEKTLRLKIQLRDVTKPPTWCEVDVRNADRPH